MTKPNLTLSAENTTETLQDYKYITELLGPDPYLLRQLAKEHSFSEEEREDFVRATKLRLQLEACKLIAQDKGGDTFKRMKEIFAGRIPLLKKDISGELKDKGLTVKKYCEKKGITVP